MNTPHFLDIPPLLQAGGIVQLPGSKSISNRVLLLAGLSQGTTSLHDLLESDDTQVMLASLRTLGCHIQLQSKVLTITGLGGQLPVKKASLFLGNAGTAMRPLTAALALLSSLHGGEFELHGVPRMHERPIADLINALRQMGCLIDCTGNEGFPPLLIRGGALKQTGPIKLRGNVSSQFLTAMLLTLPLVSQHQDAVIKVEGELISKPYIDITVALLARFGIHVHQDKQGCFTIPQGSQYHSPGSLHVEADASSASYFIAAGAIAAVQTPLRIEGVGETSIQGDIRFIDAARAMGAHIETGPNWLEVKRGEPGHGWPLKAIDMDCNHIPDAAMTLAVMALFAQGTTRLTNIASWRVKETDRIAAMACELRKLGAKVHDGADFIEITPPPSGQWRHASIQTYDDHRMAMCFSLAAFHPLVAGMDAQRVVSVRVEDPGCVAKTFPDYFATLFSVVRTDPQLIPVITVDGPSASGKGSLAYLLAQRLGYQFLDSGALYRITALLSMMQNIDIEDESALVQLAGQLGHGIALTFEGDRIWLDGADVSEDLRQEDIGVLASQISVLPGVRQALLEQQLVFRRIPGLVADGRDMGTVVFPQAGLKVFLTASVQERAKRRHRQLISKGFSVTFESVCAELEARDLRDKTRQSSPMVPAPDARLLDNSALSIDESVDQVLAWWADVWPNVLGSKANT